MQGSFSEGVVVDEDVEMSDEESDSEGSDADAEGCVDDEFDMEEDNGEAD